MKYKMKRPLSFLFAFGFFLTLMRWMGAFNGEIVVVSAEITSHITNFSLSLLTCLTAGALWLQYGVKFRYRRSGGATHRGEFRLRDTS